MWGDTDNGFGLLYNWNLLGDGVHTVVAYADGVEFASTTVIVTTLGEAFLRGVSDSYTLSDFPDPGTTRTLRWQEAQQNFVISAGSSQGGGTSGRPPRVLENPPPGSYQSGIGIISGWVCDAQRVELRFDGGSPQEAAYGTPRGDTRQVCDDTDNGFGLLYNWNLLGDGSHTVVAYADGVEFARVDVTVTTLGAEFRRGFRGREIVTDFPEVGTDTRLRWQEAQQNFVITAALPTLRLVAVDPYILLPNDIRIPNITVSSFLSETAEVRARPEPSLLLAEDAGGTVLLALANMDGGGGRGPGSVQVSVDSTAITLVGLTAGIAVSDMTHSIISLIFYHQQYPALVADLTRRLRADTNFLDRLYDEPATVRLLQAVAEPLTIAAIPQAVGATFETTTPASMAGSRCEVTKDLLQSEAALNLLEYAGAPVEGIKRVHRIVTKTIETVGEYNRCKQNFPNVWRSSIYPPPHPQPPFDETDIAGAWYADQYKIKLVLACTVKQVSAVGDLVEEVATEVGQAALEFVSGKLVNLASGGKDWLVNSLVDGYNRVRGPEVVEELVDVAQESGCDITAEDITGEDENAPPEEDITGDDDEEEEEEGEEREEPMDGGGLGGIEWDWCLIEIHLPEIEYRANFCEPSLLNPSDVLNPEVISCTEYVAILARTKPDEAQELIGVFDTCELCEGHVGGDVGVPCPRAEGAEANAVTQ